MENFIMKNSALVVIDLQNDITKNYKEIIAKVNEAIARAVQEDLWVVYIQQIRSVRLPTMRTLLRK